MSKIRNTGNSSLSQQTRDVDAMLFYCRADVGDGGPTFKHYWIIVGHVSYTVLSDWYCCASEGMLKYIDKVTCHA